MKELDHVEMKDMLDEDENICFLITVEFNYLDADNNIYKDSEVIYEPIYN